MSKPTCATEKQPTTKGGGKPRTNARINKPVFIGSAAGVLGIVLWTVLSPRTATNVIGKMFDWTTGYFGWFYIALAIGALVFLIYLGLSRYGHVKLGPANSAPEHGTFTWAAMIFAAGINVDLMFFAVSGPVSHYLAPPTGQGGTPEAAREGSIWTIFHYGLNGWAIYALMALALAYFAYRRNLPLAIRSALYPVFGKRVKGALGHGIDIAAILGTIFGVATSLGIGVVQLNFGLKEIFGIPEGLPAQLGLIGLGIGVAIASAVSGIDRGIKWLSQLNVALAGLLALFILISGDTLYLLNALVLNVGDYFNTLIGRSMETFAFDPQQAWMGNWTLFFWAWWIAYAAFIGLFLARISRGRTIREFVAGTLVLPFTYIVIWVSIFGNAAIGQVRKGDVDFGEIAMNMPEHGFYSLLKEYPLFTVVALIATLTGILFYVTTADSGALVMGHISSHLEHNDQSSSYAVRIFWGLALGALTAVMLVAGGIPVLQSATIVIALPFSIILLLVVFGFYGAIRAECGPREKPGLRKSINRAIDQRIGRFFPVAFPGEGSAQAYLEEVALPALEECSSIFQDEGIDVEVHTVESDGRGIETLEFIARPEGEPEFRYELRREHAEAESGEVVNAYVDGQWQDVQVRQLSHVQLQDEVAEKFQQRG